MDGVYKILIADDDFSSRTLLQRFLEKYGDVDVTIDGAEAVMAFQTAIDATEPYGLICLDIMMPEVDGISALAHIRNKEKAMGITPENAVTIIMTTSLDPPLDLIDAFYKGVNRCDDYVTKPIDFQVLSDILLKYGIHQQ
ncbi:response regulator [Candidatus Magnetomonas plexicatena]|uniref:response regulator n=1 Tax=Candidatus Magnetomonas plexicatena TaxID=2552947 RepID=UPI001C76536D|nr:response regulator transcription factor [Nitrospirales bacterium LBB_01]